MTCKKTFCPKTYAFFSYSYIKLYFCLGQWHATQVKVVTTLYIFKRSFSHCANRHEILLMYNLSFLDDIFSRFKIKIINKWNREKPLIFFFVWTIASDYLMEWQMCSSFQWKGFMCVNFKGMLILSIIEWERRRLLYI